MTTPPLNPSAQKIQDNLRSLGFDWSAAGTPNAVFEMPVADLQKMTGGKVVQVK